MVRERHEGPMMTAPSGPDHEGGRPLTAREREVLTALERQFDDPNAASPPSTFRLWPEVSPTSARRVGLVVIAGLILGAMLISPAGVVVLLVTTGVLLAPWLMLLAVERRGRQHGHDDQ